MGLATFDCLEAFKRTVTVCFAETRADLLEAQRLRHQVFCEEHTILDSKDGIEADQFDGRARHVILRKRGGEVVGTARLVPCDRDRPFHSFPMQLVCPVETFIGLPIATTGEISRFSISRQRRDLGDRGDHLLQLGLMRGILQLSREMGVTHWCAAMELSLLRLLRYASIRFQPIGAPIDYRGLRQPAVARISDVLERGHQERPAFWDYVTDGGRLHPAFAAPAGERVSMAA
jgi:N-acyl-L-homoserine lactone synthetase